MKRILYTWELGANYGHLSRLLLLAKRQIALGNEVLFAVQDITIAERLLLSERIQYVQAPIFKAKSTQHNPVNYAEMLLLIGYADEIQLALNIRQWLALITEFDPQFIIMDHSPTVILASRICNIPSLQIGSGFEIPPDEDWPAFVEPNSALPLNVADFNQTLLDKINHVLNQFETPLLPNATALFSEQPKALVTFNELDHYPSRKNGLYVGSIYAINNGLKVSWDANQKQKIFVYIWPGLPGLNALLTALKNIDAEVIAVIPGLSAEAMSNLTAANIRIYTETLCLDGLLKQADLLITHSGFGVLSAFIQKGIPVLVIPKTIEQYLIGRRITELGIGIAMGHKRDTNQFMWGIRQLLSGAHYKVAAAKIADKYRTYSYHDALSAIENLMMQIIEVHKGKNQYISA